MSLLPEDGLAVWRVSFPGHKMLEGAYHVLGDRGAVKVELHQGIM